MLEYKEPYIVPTEQSKNRTCQSYRWKQIAMSEDLQELKKMMKRGRRIVDWDTLEVMCSEEYQ